MKLSFFLLLLLLSFGTACTDEMETLVVDEPAPTAPFGNASFFLHIGPDYLPLEKEEAGRVSTDWIKSVEVWEAKKAAEKFGTSGQYEAVVFEVYPEMEEQVLTILKEE